jgi:hypothetical protein
MKYLIKNIKTGKYFSQYEDGKAVFVGKTSHKVRIFDSLTYTNFVKKNMSENNPKLEVEIEKIK